MAVGMQGEAEIVRKLRALSKRAGRNAMRRALRKGAIVVRNAARANAKRIDDPRTASDISRNIAVQAGSRKKEQEYGGIVMRVGVMGGARFRKAGGEDLPGKNTTHWRYVEFGTSTEAAHPFMRPAASNSAGAVATVVAAAAEAEIDKEIAKL